MPVAVVVKDQTNSAAVTSRVHYMHLQPRKCHCSNMGGVMPASGTYSVTLPPKLGGERNRKQRIPVNSITSKLVLKSIYASGSTGPFFADHYLNI